MRLVFDTNVLINGFKDNFSAEAQLIEAVLNGSLTAIATPAIQRENTKILRRLIHDRAYQAKIQQFLAATEEVEPAVTAVTIDDPDDVKFLEAAVGGQADMIVTSDRHLLDLGAIGHTDIVTPLEAKTRYEEESGGNSAWQNFARGLGIGLLIVFCIIPPLTHAAESTTTNDIKQNESDIADKQKEIDDLNKKIADLTAQRDTTAAEANIIANKVAELKASLEKAQLELKQTKLSLTKVQTEQASTSDDIAAVESEVADMRLRLRELVRQLNSAEQTSLVQIFFSNLSLSDVLAERAAYEQIQSKTVQLIQDLHAKEDDLHTKQDNLISQQNELTQLEKIQAAQKQEVAAAQSEQKQFLEAKKSEQVAFEAKIKEAQEAREEIKKNMFTLKSSGVEVTFTSALDMAKYAGSLTGVSPALLMAVLKVESNLGANVGSGKYPEDMQPASREAFVRITDKLGIDRATAQISRRPTSGNGWGGAMGPAQIMPATWEGIEGRIESLTKKSPVNPYDLTDAFVATGIFMADRGAAQGNEEQQRQALARYIAGPNWPYWVHSWYTDKIMAVAAEYQKEL